MLGKKLAKIFRKENLILVKKQEEYLWVSNTYILVRLKEKEAEKFLNKYNNYKTTKDIPFLESGETYEILYSENKKIDKDPIGNLLNNISNDLKDVEITKFSRLKDNMICRIFKSDNKLGLFDNKYSFLMDKFNLIKIEAGDKYNPLILKNKNKEVCGLIMPVRINKLLRDLKKLAV